MLFSRQTLIKDLGGVRGTVVRVGRAWIARYRCGNGLLVYYASVLDEYFTR